MQGSEEEEEEAFFASKHFLNSWSSLRIDPEENKLNGEWSYYAIPKKTTRAAKNIITAQLMLFPLLEKMTRKTEKNSCLSKALIWEESLTTFNVFCKIAARYKGRNNEREVQINKTECLTEMQ